MTVMFCVVKGISDLVFAEGLNKACIDVVDGKPKNQNNNILGQSFREGVWKLTSRCHIYR